MRLRRVRTFAEKSLAISRLDGDKGGTVAMVVVGIEEDWASGIYELLPQLSYSVTLMNFVTPRPGAINEDKRIIN